MIVAGLDPGKLGAIAFICTEFNNCWASPTVLKKTIDGGEFLDPLWLQKELYDWCPNLVVVERQHPRPMDGKKSVFSLGRGYGRIEAVLELFKYRTLYVSPQEWKEKVLKGTKKDKQAAISWVKNMYPEVDLNPPGWENKDHDGVADAVCLAYFGMKHL